MSILSIFDALTAANLPVGGVFIHMANGIIPYVGNGPLNYESFTMSITGSRSGDFYSVNNPVLIFGYLDITKGGTRVIAWDGFTIQWTTWYIDGDIEFSTNGFRITVENDTGEFSGVILHA